MKGLELYAWCRKHNVAEGLRCLLENIRVGNQWGAFDTLPEKGYADVRITISPKGFCYISKIPKKVKKIKKMIIEPNTEDTTNKTLSEIAKESKEGKKDVREKESKNKTK